MGLSKERCRYIAVKDGKYLTKDGKFTSNLWAAAVVRRDEVKEQNVEFKTVNDLFDEIKDLITYHERLRDKHAEIAHKLEFLKFVS